MGTFPVILCGGAGTRLWPASRPSRPKPFIRLTGEQTLFQQAAARVTPLVDRAGRLIVVGAEAHRAFIDDQLGALGLTADVLLEPVGRDSAPAMAAAAVHAAAIDPEAVLVIVASDHFIGDLEAFRAAIAEALPAARAGRIVTMGVRPTGPNPAYGYILPAADGPSVQPVSRFSEKPTRAEAETRIAEGWLWNSGNFIVAARTLIAELDRHCPELPAAVRVALEQADRGLLGPAFGAAPRVSIDYAVMEKTDRAGVLPVDFPWSDLGAWDAIAATGQGDQGLHIEEDADGCLVRAPEGVMVGLLGVSDLAVVVEPDAVLVCGLERAGDLKLLVERVRDAAPAFLDAPAIPPEPADLATTARAFADWFRLSALPLWASLGQAENGQFAETLTLDGRPDSPRFRARVQARQIQVYAQAAKLGWTGRWTDAVRGGLERLNAAFLRPDGQVRTLLSAAGAPLDETAMLYDQAFVLLALATARQAGLEGDHQGPAARIRNGLSARNWRGGYRENGVHPFQSNAHMHLLEAALEWETLEPEPWTPISDGIATLALDRFIDDGGRCREFFDEDWGAAPGADGLRVEPGHQFEWAWLLSRYGRRRGDERALAAARRLHERGREGLRGRPPVAIDAMDATGATVEATARLWPQTEWLKSSLAMGQTAEAAEALAAINLYLTPDGLWRDRRDAEGGMDAGPAPASSLYHLLTAFTQLCDSASAGDVPGLDRLDLS